MPPRRVVILLALVVMCAPPVYLVLTNKGVTFDAPLFITEYLKFLATLTSIALGWLLVNVYWDSREASRRTRALTALLAGQLARLRTINYETVELIENPPAEYGESRHRYVEANLHRMRDLLVEMSKLRDALRQSDLLGIPGFLGASAVIDEMQAHLSAVLAGPHAHTYDIGPQQLELLKAVGRIAERPLLDQGGRN